MEASFFWTDMNSGREIWRAVSILGELGFVIALPLVFMIPLGVFLDQRYDSKPWLMMLGIAVAFGVSIFLVYKKVQALRPRIEKMAEDKKV